MSHTYTNLLVHCVFSTKERRGLLGEDVRRELWSYMAGIARNHNMKAIAVGGTANHCHILLSMQSAQCVAESVKTLKANSSRWVKQRFPALDRFSWQQGYGAFSIGISQAENTIQYIERQMEHHRQRTFKEEFLAFLKRHRIEYDPRYIWD
jgi:REP element-mobilizing transposase RayT